MNEFEWVNELMWMSEWIKCEWINELKVNELMWMSEWILVREPVNEFEWVNELEGSNEFERVNGF